MLHAHHASPAAALRYQHATEEHERRFGDGLVASASNGKGIHRREMTAGWRAAKRRNLRRGCRAFTRKSGRRGSNSHHQLGRLRFCH